MVAVDDVVHQHRQSVGGGGSGRGESGVGHHTGLGHPPHRSGGVVDRDRLPAPVGDDRLRLGQGFGMGQDTLHLVDGGTGDPQQAVTDLDHVLGDDAVVTREQPVEDGEDAAGGGVLDGHHQPVHLLGGQGLEGGHEGGEADPHLVGEELGGGAVGVREILALITDLHAAER